MDRVVTNKPAEINPLGQIQIRDDALAQHRQHLEEEVAQRTAALEEANVLLGKELAERGARERELQSANEQLSILLDSLPIAIYRCKTDDNYKVLYMSPNVVFFTGYEAGSFIEEADLWLRRIHPDDAAQIAVEMTILFEKGMNACIYRWRNADGNYRWIQDSQRLIRHRDGTPDYMVGMWQDITESKDMELRLRESEQRFRNVAELTTDWVWQVDESGTYVYSGKKVHDLLGYSPEEVCGKTPFDFMPPDEAARVAEIFKNIASKKIPFSFLENINLHKDGHRVILETSGVPLLDDDGIFHGYFGTERDITERKRAAQALEESELKFRAILDAAVDGILVADVQTHQLITANRAICDMLGYLPEEIYRLGLEDIHPAEALSHVQKQFERQMKGDIRVAPNLPVKRKDGSVFYADVSSSPMVLAGRPYLVGVFHDVTERRQAEEKVREINEELEEKVRARTQQLLTAQEDLLRKEKLAVLGQVAGSVGHELRNPLGVMSNAVYFLQTVLSDADEITKEYLNILKSEIASSERIVSDLLDSVRTKPPQVEAVGVAELIGQTLGKLTIPPVVMVTSDIPATLSPLRVDAQQIRQVFRNLISNGVEAMPQGGTLDIRAVENRQDGTVTVSVQDSGIGMTPEQMARLFQPLFTTKTRGIGLGLVVVKNLTEANGGKVDVQSEAGKGTTFTITLPSVASAAETNDSLST